jgi:hypothetical protein
MKIASHPFAVSTDRLLTRHALERMCKRRLSEDALGMVLAYGRSVRVRGAEICAIGRREVARYRRDGIDLAQFEGIQAVCSHDGPVITAYRNRDFTRLRDKTRRGRRRLGLRTARSIG